MNFSHSFVQTRRNSEIMSDGQLAFHLISHADLKPDSFLGKLIMSLTYGCESKDVDKFSPTSAEATEKMSPLILPGGALVNHIPFCATSNFILSIIVGLTAMFQ